VANGYVAPITVIPETTIEPSSSAPKETFV